MRPPSEPSQFTCLGRYLAAQKLTWSITVTSITTICTHVVISDVMVARYGLSGAGWANAIANWTLLTLLSMMIVAQRCYARRAARAPSPGGAKGKRKTSDDDHNAVLREGDGLGVPTPPPHDTDLSMLLLTWPSPFSRDVLRGWGPLLELGAPSAVSMIIENGGYELNATIAGHLGIKELATHSVFAQYSALFYALPNGVAQAAATLGSNALGGGDAETAKRLVPLAYGCCLVCGVAQGLVTLHHRHRMGALFSRDAEVIRMTSDIAPIFCLGYEIADVWKCAGMTYLRETGRPAICARVAGGSVLLFALPLSYCMAMLWGYGLAGVWLGAAAGWYLCGTVFTALLWQTDWGLEARKAVAAQRNPKPAPRRLGSKA